MIEREVTVRNRAGLHTRPASMIVKTASQYQSEIFLRRDNYEINGKSVIGVMTLAAEQGATITLVVEGEDEEEAASAITELFDDGFGEEME
jgi:phosphocarrier protein